MPTAATGGRRARRVSLLFPVCAGIFSLALGGCSFFQQPTNVEVTRQEVEKISRQQAELLTLLQQQEKRLEAQSEALAALRADSNQQMGEIQETLIVLRAQLEEQGVRFDRMRRQIKVDPPPPGPDTTATGTAFPPIPGAGQQGTAEDVLVAARQDFARGNYQLAIAGFEEYLRLEPEGEQAADAQYELANSYFSLGDMDQAIPQFIKVRDLYDGSNAVPAATLKLGYCFLRTGDEATARRYFEMVITEFPDSEEAPLARDKLATLK